VQQLIKNILTSRVYEAAIETPLEESAWLSERLGNQVFLKREDLQPVFSFKLRGAYNKISHLDEAELNKGVITASAGNHAQGVAFSARQLGISALIVMPVTTPQIKVSAVEILGAEVILFGDNYSEAADHCKGLVKQRGMTFIHPFDDDLVIAGQGTIADELLRQTAGKMDMVFVPVGGGGLIAGIAAYLKYLCPQVKVIGVEPEDSDAMARSLESGHPVSLENVGIFADGVAVRDVGHRTFELCQKYVDEIVRVDTDAICSAIKQIYQSTRSIVEPAGALAVAGLEKYVKDNSIRDQRLVAINSGANMNFERLRYVAERTMSGERQEALFAVTIPEQAGALKTFCNDIIGDRNITEFNYRLAGRDGAHIFVGIAVRDDLEREAFSKQLEEGGYTHTDLTANELAKTHIRYMVGGRSTVVGSEVLYRFWFPERPGALSRFLGSMGANWNISLFHYRHQGGDFGRVLIGLEIPDGEEAALPDFLNNLGYRFVCESDNPAFKLFL
jgi:threonine dehydratase